MRFLAILFVVFLLPSQASPKDRRPMPTVPNQFEVGRHTFFDFGPPTDFYELFSVRPSAHGTIVERITLTPAADSCFQPTEVQAHLARQVYRDFGKTSGHPAKLNFGDCFSYALAKAKGEPLLFKGQDFSRTDVKSARA